MVESEFKDAQTQHKAWHSLVRNQVVKHRLQEISKPPFKPSLVHPPSLAPAHVHPLDRFRDVCVEHHGCAVAASSRVGKACVWCGESWATGVQLVSDLHRVCDRLGEATRRSV